MDMEPEKDSLPNYPDPILPDPGMQATGPGDGDGRGMVAKGPEEMDTGRLTPPPPEALGFTRWDVLLGEDKQASAHGRLVGQVVAKDEEQARSKARFKFWRYVKGAPEFVVRPEGFAIVVPDISEIIYAGVHKVLQPAEEIGGPTGEEYIRLMEAIAAECNRRIAACRQAMSDSQRKE